MKIINVDINDEIIFKNVLDVDTGVITGISSGVKLPTGNYNNIKLNFSFANQKLCEKFNIFASFKINNGTPIIQELEPMTIENVTYERACNIPNEVFQDKCEVTLGVYGYRLNEDETLDKRFSLVPVRNFVIEGSYDPDSQEGIVPTPTVFEIYFDKINKAEEDIQAMLEQGNSDIESMLNQCETDYNTFKAEKDAEVNDFLNNAEGQFMGTVQQLETEFADTQALVTELSTNVDEAEIKVEEMGNTVENMGTSLNKMQGDLYTQDRYNKPTISLSPIESGVLTRNLFEKLNSTSDTMCKNLMVEIEASSSTGGYLIKNAFDGSTSNYWYSASATTSYVLMKFLRAVKLKKLKTYINCNGSLFTSAIIQGSNDNASWTDLHTISEKQTALTDIELANPDYYLYYRIYFTLSGSTQSRIYDFQVTEWEGTYYECVADLSLPLASYETGKIVNIEGNKCILTEADYVEEEFDTNIIPVFPANSDIINKYGTWRIGTDYSSSTIQYKAFDGDDTTLFGTARDKAEYSIWIENVEAINYTGSAIKPAEIYIKSAYHQAIKVEGITPEGATELIATISASSSTSDVKTTTLTVSPNNYYTKFIVKIASYGTSYGAELYTFAITKGLIRYGVVSEKSITSFENPYLNINNLGAKKINGTIYKDNQYSLMYNGEGWDIFPQKKLIFEKVLDIDTPNITISGLHVRKGQKLLFEICGRANEVLGLQTNPSITQEYYDGSSSYSQSALIGRLDSNHSYIGFIRGQILINPVDGYAYTISEFYLHDSDPCDWGVMRLRTAVQEINELKFLGYYSNPTQTSYKILAGTIIRIWQE